MLIWIKVIGCESLMSKGTRVVNTNKKHLSRDSRQKTLLEYPHKYTPIDKLQLINNCGI